MYTFIYEYFTIFKYTHKLCLKRNAIGCAVWAVSKRGISGLFYHLTWILRVYNCNTSFLQPLHFFYMLLFTPLFFSLFSKEHWETNSEHQAMNKSEIFSCGGGKFCHKQLKCFSKCMEITCYAQKVLSYTRDSKRIARRWKMTPGGGGGLQQTGLRSTLSELGRWCVVDFLNDHKSAGHEKWQCLEDYQRRFV